MGETDSKPDLGETGFKTSELGKMVANAYKKEVSLIVEEARQRDVGRYIIRLNNATVKTLDLRTGDIVEVKGKSVTTAMVWPAYPQDQNQDVARIDDQIRRKIGVEVGKIITIRKVNPQPAINDWEYEAERKETVNTGLKTLTDALGGNIGKSIGEGVKEMLTKTNDRMPEETLPQTEQDSLAQLKFMKDLIAMSQTPDSPEAMQEQLFYFQTMLQKQREVRDAALLAFSNVMSPPPPGPNMVPSEHRCPLPWVVYQLRALLDAPATTAATFYREKLHYILNELNGGK